MRSLGKVIDFRINFLHYILCDCLACMCSKALGMYLEGSHSKEVKGFGFKRAA